MGLFAFVLALSSFYCSNNQPKILIQMVYNDVCFLFTSSDSHCPC